MSEEEASKILSQNLHKLEIVPKTNSKCFDDNKSKNNFKYNPFAKRSRFKSVSQVSLFGPSCVCRKNRVCKNKKITNLNKNKVLRDPVIVLHEKCKHELSLTAKAKIKSNKTKSDSDLSIKSKSGSFSNDNYPHQDFRSIISGCESLSLSSDDLPNFSNQNFRETNLNSSASGSGSASTSRGNNNENNRDLVTCSQQAMARICLNPPCDVTIDELASYFETFVHIPKKMSSMAEMMYI